MWALIHTLLYNVGTPLWQVPDEPAHVEYACVIAERGLTAGLAERSSAVQQVLIRSLAAADFWYWVGRPTPDPLPTSFDEDPFLRNAGRQIGDEPPLSYLLPALICQVRPPAGVLPAASFTLQVHLMRLVSGLFFVAAVAAAWWAGRGVWPTTEPAVVAMTATLAGLPMLAFLSAGVNNDIPVVLWGTLMFGSLARLLRQARGRWAWLVLLTALLAAFSKKTAFFLLPLAAAAVVWWLLRWRRAVRRPVWIAGGLLVLLLGLLFLWPSNRPAGWSGRGQPWSGGRTRLAAHSGTYGVHVVDRDTRDFGRIVQRPAWPDLPSLQGQTVRLSAWVRAAPGQPLRMTVRDNAGESQTRLIANGSWQWVAVTRTLAANLTDVLVGIAPGPGLDPAETGELDADDVSLVVVTGGTGGAAAASFLRNGDLESSPSWGSVLVQPMLVEPLRNWLLNPLAAWLRAMPAGAADWSRSLLYVALLFPGFWGNFGWLQVPLPLPLYGVLAAVCGLALVGNLAWWQRSGTSEGLERKQERTLARWGLAGILLAFVEIGLPMLGRDWQPQARYLYAALFPLLAFLVCGLRYWSRRWGLSRALAWYVAGFLVLDIISYFAVLLPHYRVG